MNKAKATRIELMERIVVIYEEVEAIRRLLKRFDEDVYNRADSTWIAHIDGALYSQFGWSGGSIVSANDTIDQIVEVEEGEE